MMKKYIRMFFVLCLALTATFSSFAFDTVSPTSELSVKHDNGTGNVYAKLAVNYVQFGKLDLSKATVSGSGYHKTTGYTGTTTDKQATVLYYETTYSKLNWGKNATSSNDASPKSTELPMVTLTFPNAATLSDGSKADVCITDTPKLYLGENLNNKIDSSTKLKIAIMRYDTKLWFSLTAPKTSFEKAEYTASNKSTGAATARHDTVHIYIRKPGTSTAISSASYPSMLLVFKDLDTPDHMVASGSSRVSRWNGSHAEGITLGGSGWGNPVALAPDDSSKHITQRCLVNKQITSAGNLKIKGDGKKMDLLADADISYNDHETYYSGFAVAGTPQSLYFGWDGSIKHGEDSSSDMGTIIGAQPTVDVKSKRSEGGTLRGSKLNAWGSTTHLMNSSADYTFKPDSGYRVEYLKVDGKAVTLTEAQKTNGGKYTFTRLNKYPVEVKDKKGNVLGASDSSHYTIEVKFVKSVEYGTLKITKNVTGNLGDITKEFDFTISLSNLTPDMKGEITNNGAALASGFDGSSYKAGADGKATLKFRLKDDAALTLKGLPVGTSYEITEAKSDHIPSYTVTKGTAKIASGAQNKNAAMSTGALTISESADYTAAFVNSRDLLPPTGNAERNIPFSLPAAAGMTACILACALTCIVAALIRGRRKF